MSIITSDGLGIEQSFDQWPAEKLQGSFMTVAVLGPEAPVSDMAVACRKA
jgi:hypothetical protein